MIDGPSGVRIVSGASCLLGETDFYTGLLHELTELEQDHDWLILDAVAGPFARAADCTLIVTTPEPTAIAEAYATLKGLSATDGSRASALVNRADSEHQALQVLERLRHAGRSFLRTDLDRAGFIPNDSAVWQSVSARRPLVEVEPNCPAQQALEGLADRLARTVTSRNEVGYFQRLMQSQEASFREERLDAA